MYRRTFLAGTSVSVISSSALGRNLINNNAQVSVGVEEVDNGLNVLINDGLIEFSKIKKGKFYFGSNENYINLDHKIKRYGHVEIGEDFYISKYLFTFGNYRDIYQRYPDWMNLEKVHGEKYPIRLSYDAIMDILRILNQSESVKFSLPTEEQWEYACRAGSHAKYYNSDQIKELDRIAWHKGNSKGIPHPVGQLEPNKFGLYDMLGSLWEPCVTFSMQFYHSDTGHRPICKQNQICCARGGDYFEDPEFCNNYYVIDNERSNGIGAATGLRMVLIR